VYDITEKNDDKRKRIALRCQTFCSIHVSGHQKIKIQDMNFQIARQVQNVYTNQLLDTCKVDISLTEHIDNYR